MARSRDLLSRLCLLSPLVWPPLSQIPVDFIDEDALEEPGTLSQYKQLWLTQPNIPAAGLEGIARWVREGGVVVSVSNAGVTHFLPPAHLPHSPLKSSSRLQGAEMSMTRPPQRSLI